MVHLKLILLVVNINLIYFSEYGEKQSKLICKKLSADNTIPKWLWPFTSHRLVVSLERIMFQQSYHVGTTQEDVWRIKTRIHQLYLFFMYIAQEIASSVNYKLLRLHLGVSLWDTADRAFSYWGTRQRHSVVGFMIQCWTRNCLHMTAASRCCQEDVVAFLELVFAVMTDNNNLSTVGGVSLWWNILSQSHFYGITI